VRNSLARKDCIRGKFKDYYLQGQGGDPAADYKGKVFKLSQDYPAQLPPAEDYPWLKIPFKNGGPADPQAYLQALLDYGLAGQYRGRFLRPGQQNPQMVRDAMDGLEHRGCLGLAGHRRSRIRARSDARI
jgi:hypothetical protein